MYLNLFQTSCADVQFPNICMAVFWVDLILELQVLSFFFISSFIFFIQTGLEKNLFGSHPVSLPAAEIRSPPLAFATDPLLPTNGREYAASLSSSVGKDAEGHQAGIRGSNILEIDGPSSASPSPPNLESSYIKNSSPAGVRQFCCSYLIFHLSF